VIFSNSFLTAQWQNVKSLFRRWRILLFGPLSKFKIGDRVQLVEGEGFMLVTEVIAFPGMKEPLLQCKWYDPESRETKTSIFSESKISFFEGKPPRKTRIRSNVVGLINADTKKDKIV
jgi:uncharacterized protein YodC (DUF2158 family)